MSLDLHTAAAALYLAAAIVATLGVALRAPARTRLAVRILVLAALCHAVAFFAYHDFRVPPPSTGLPGAISLMAWLATVFFLALAGRHRLEGLAVVVAPGAFLGVFFFAVARPVALSQPPDPAWGAAHVLLASAGLALLAVSGAAGLLFVAHHRGLKAKRPRARLPLPPLEALDRVTALAVYLGFLLLSLGVVSGVLWVHETQGRLWPGTAHAWAALLAWAVYAGLVGARVVARQGAHRFAVSAVGSFALALVAVIGVEVLL